MENINIEKIKQEIKEEIKIKEMKAPSVKFKNIRIKNMEMFKRSNKFDKNKLYSLLKELEYMWKVEPYKEIVGNKCKVFVKKAIRKSVKFLILPMVEDQNKVNATLIQSIGSIEDFIYEQIKLNKELQIKVKKLEKEKEN